MTIHKLDYSFPNLEPVCFPRPVLTVASSPTNRFLRKQVSWPGIPLCWRIFQFFSDPQIFCDPHNLPWSVDLTFQVPMQYSSLQHWTWLPSPVTSTTGHCFHFGSISSFFLKLFLQSPVAYWAPTDLGSSFFSVLSFCLFILFMEFSRQEYWSGLPFPSPVDHVLSELSTMTCPFGWPYTAWLIVSLS